MANRLGVDFTELCSACNQPVTFHRSEYDRSVRRGPELPIKLGEPADHLPCE